MVRVNKSVASHRRRKVILSRAKGYYGDKSRLPRAANEQVMRSLRYAYRDRRTRKREFRRLWIQRINAICRENGTTYSKFISQLSTQGVEVNRKVLSDLAVSDPAAFKKLIQETL